MCNPTVAAGLIGGGGGLLESLFAPSATAGSNINLTRGPASQYLNDLQSGKGLGTGAFDPAMISKLFGSSLNNILTNRTNDLSSGGRVAAGQALSSGVSNPWAIQSHAQNSIYQSYAPQIGANAMGEANAQLQQQDKLSQLRTQLTGLGGSVGGETNQSVINPWLNPSKWQGNKFRPS